MLLTRPDWFQRWSVDMPEIDHHFLIEAVELFESQSGESPSAVSESVAARIWHALDADLPDALRSAAYWALAKRYRKDDKPRFVAALQREIARSSSVAYQIMIALDNLDEPVFAPGRSGKGILEVEQNLADAKRYLAEVR